MLFAELDYPTGHFVRVWKSEARKKTGVDIFVADSRNIDNNRWYDIINEANPAKLSCRINDCYEDLSRKAIYYVRTGRTHFDFH